MGTGPELAGSADHVDHDVRRRLGIAYTPGWIVLEMLRWAKTHASPARIIDPGAGTGNFTLAAAEAFPEAHVLAIEIEPKSAELLRKAVRRSPHGARIEVREQDFLSILELPAIEGRTLFIGNPPYVRHHLVTAAQKGRLLDWARELNLPANTKPGLHLHFFFQARRLARQGDYGVFIAAAEWLRANYGAGLRGLLLDGMGGMSIDTFATKDFVFPGHMTTAAVVCFEVGHRSDMMAFSELRDPRQFRIGTGAGVAVASLKEQPWVAHQLKSTGDTTMALSDLFRVKRGQVTGSNDVWIYDGRGPVLPTRFLRPAITRAREIIESKGEILPGTELRRVVDLPVRPRDLPEPERSRVLAYITWARKMGGHESYIAQHRRKWWSVELYEPAPIVCTYMARRPPAFALNTAHVPNLNISHGLYPKGQMSGALLRRLVDWLNANVEAHAGRPYAGGLYKFEPGDVAALRIPTALLPKRLHNPV